MSSSNDILEQLRNGFKGEAIDLLVELDSALLALESNVEDVSLVHRVFRAIHTIKGSSGVAGLAHLARFTHNVEEAFQLAREGRLAITPELIDCALKACDVIRLLLDHEGEDLVLGETEVTQSLKVLLGKDGPRAQTGAPAKAPVVVSSRTAYDIVLKPHREIFYSGGDPVTLLIELRDIGQAHIVAHTDAIPPLGSLEPEHCYLWWEIFLVTESDLARVKEVFVFAESDCEIEIKLLDDQVGALALLGSVPAETLELFRVECEEQLELIEAAALALERQPKPGHDLDALFRGVHNIKGNAGVLLGQISSKSLISSHPLHLLHKVTHALESLLDPFRSASTQAIPEQVVQTALDTCDSIRNLLAALTNQKDGAGAVSPELFKRLGVKAGSAPSDSSANDRAAAFQNTSTQWVDMIAGCVARINEGSDLAPPLLETYLRGVKTLSSAAQYQNYPQLEEPLALQLRILDRAMQTGAALGEAERSDLGNAFQSVCTILKQLAASGETKQEQDQAVEAPAQKEAPPSATRPPASSAGSTIRIEQEKLDRLMRVAGELLVARGAFPVLVQKLNSGADVHAVAKELKEAGSNVSRITDDLQASVMSIRMLPAKTIFQKLPRLVRDLARSLNKDVRLVIEGEGTELDKTILEQIGDPLIHVIRNAVDHGLELPEERIAKGKSASGLLRVRASNEAGGVVIEVTDDGKGLNAEALKRKAVEKGLVSLDSAASMSDEAAFQLIFLPGLSTAAKVTDVSGRGVGMDVVRSNVRNLQGTIEIQSKRGLGTTFFIKLPTSLIISKGILLEASGQEYILPLTSIREMVKVPQKAAHQYRGLKLTQIRGHTYPLVLLSEALGLPASEKAELSIAIVQVAGLEYGLVVDRFVSEVEVLVKPLSGGLAECREFQGAAIMGDGRVVLVLNALECHCLQKAHTAR